MPGGTNVTIELFHRYAPHLISFEQSYSYSEIFLFMFFRSMLSYVEKKKCLPGTWFIQLDNTVKYVLLAFCCCYLIKFCMNLTNTPLLFFHRENKNRYVLAFLKSLVDCGLFEHIYLNFLPVGHTHCDIDQLFSRIAVWMRGVIILYFVFLWVVFLFVFKSILDFFSSANESYTWDELAAAIKKAYLEITQVYLLPKFINWSESIHPFLNDAAKTPG